MCQELQAGKLHRANASASTPFDYYLRNMCLPFLDYLIEGLNTRFDKYGSIIHKIHAFVPSMIRMGKVERNCKMEEIIHEYRNDLPTARNAFEIIHEYRNAFEESSKWERRWKAVPKENRPNSVAKVLKVCDMDSYPNIYVLLKILRTVAVTSCECERSEIVLKRLNTYL